MAKNIADTGTVVDIKRGRGRPKGGGPTPGKAAAAAKKAEEMIGGVQAPAAPQGVQEDERRAPAFGSNEPDVGVFLKHVQVARKDAEEEEKLKSALKARRKVTKDNRQLAKAEGIVLGELDRAMKDADTEQVDLDARERRYALYMDWLGKPISYQAELPGMARPTDTEADQARWFKRGDQDGRLGKARTVPEGCPSIHVQDYLKGHEAGQMLLMKSSPLTAAAFDPAKAAKPAESDTGMVQFSEAHFQAGTDLEDANLKSLLPGHHEAFHNAVTVVAIFGQARRILKEPGYTDTGEADVEITEPEPVSGAEAFA